MSESGTREKVLLVIGDAAEVGDTIYPYYRVPEDGYEIVVAAPEKRLYHLVQHELRPDWDITVEMPGYHMKSDIAFRDIDPDQFLGMVISGGRAPEYLRYDEDLIRLVKQFDEAGKPIGSVCHGIEIVAMADIIRGRRLTCVPKCKFDAEVCGGIWLDEAVVVDGNLVTARVAQDNTEWMREFMKVLNVARDNKVRGVL
ncbi:MAG TPA: DJ-1/PfpI family protein [candidate division Zixibacteria bacterium]|nr:DJ-1/PfpI family protein [candidate division Zixibacteria bacterium]